MKHTPYRLSDCPRFVDFPLGKLAKSSTQHIRGYSGMIIPFYDWRFQEPALKVPTMYGVYVETMQGDTS
jgi:hypothetical protein